MLLVAHGVKALEDELEESVLEGILLLISFCCHLRINLVELEVFNYGLERIKQKKYYRQYQML
jgi:hypothetical protein